MAPRRRYAAGSAGAGGGSSSSDEGDDGDGVLGERASRVLTEDERRVEARVEEEEARKAARRQVRARARARLRAPAPALARSRTRPTRPRVRACAAGSQLPRRAGVDRVGPHGRHVRRRPRAAVRGRPRRRPRPPRVRTRARVPVPPLARVRSLARALMRSHAGGRARARARMHPRVQTRYLAAWGAGVAVNTAIFVYIALVRPYVLGDTREWEVRGAGGHGPLAARVHEHARAGARAQTCTGATDAHARTRSARAHARDRCLTRLATPSGPPLPPPSPRPTTHARPPLASPHPPRPPARAGICAVGDPHRVGGGRGVLRVLHRGRVAFVRLARAGGGRGALLRRGVRNRPRARRWAQRRARGRVQPARQRRLSARARARARRRRRHAHTRTGPRVAQARVHACGQTHALPLIRAHARRQRAAGARPAGDRTRPL